MSRINQEYRSKAMEVVACTPALQPMEQGKQKAYMYGLIAQAASQIILPTPEELLGPYEPGEINTVTDLLADDLKAQCDLIWIDDPEAHSRFEEAAMTRLSMHDADVSSEDVFAYLYGGVNTAMNAEAVTLATIKKRTLAGQTITRQGLIKSQRIPFAFAMQNIINLDLEDPGLFEYQYLPDAHKRGVKTRAKVFRDHVVDMDPDKGVTLPAGVNLPDDYLESDDEPTIGCPVTLIKHFIRDVHTLAADACVQAGVIPIAES